MPMNPVRAAKIMNIMIINQSNKIKEVEITKVSRMRLISVSWL